MSPPTRWGREHFLHDQPGPVVVVTSRGAAWLEVRGLGALRVNARGIDPEIDAMLSALHFAALSWRSATSARAEADAEAFRPDAEVAPVLTVNTTKAAELLDISPRAVRLAAKAGRLQAEKVGGQWRITREDVEHFRASRRAA